MNILRKIGYFGLAPDMIYRICPSNKRALATAVFVGFERCFGTTFPPYIAGLVTENYQNRYGEDFTADPSKYSEKDWFIVRFQAIEAALYSIAIYALISTGETFLKYEYFDIFSANLFFINFLRFFGW